MLTETAFVKLGWVLGHEEWIKDNQIIKEKMLKIFLTNSIKGFWSNSF
jgi:hypothetical protein